MSVFIIAKVKLITQVLTINASTGEYEALKPGKATVTVTMTCDEGSDSRFAVING